MKVNIMNEESLYKVGDEVSIYDPINDEYITRKVEAVCYTDNDIFYITDPIDLCLLGVSESELPIPQHQLNRNKLNRDLKKCIKKQLFTVKDGKIVISY